MILYSLNEPILKPFQPDENLSLKNDSQLLEEIEQHLKRLNLSEPTSSNPSNSLRINTLSDLREDSDSDSDVSQIEENFKIEKQKFPPSRNYYPRPTPIDLQFEEAKLEKHVGYSAGTLYEWNIDGIENFAPACS